jgi:hypothetical protein
MPTTNNGTQRSPDEWVSGGEPMTEAQASFLKRLSEDAGEAFDPNLSKADASKRIDELRSRGAGSSRPRARGRTARPAREQEDTPEGVDRMSTAQAAYLKELADEEGGDFDPELTKEEGARRIGELLIRQMARTSPTEPSRR